MGIFVTGNISSESWMEPSKPANFYYLSSIVSKILNKLGIKDVSTDIADPTIFQQGIVFKKGNKVLVSAGMVQEKRRDLVTIR